MAGRRADQAKGRPVIRRLAAHLPPVLLVTAVVLGVFAPLAAGKLLLGGEDVTSDLLSQVLPWRMATGRALAAGDLPLWTDRFFGGYPLLANPAVGTLYPLNWVFAFLPPVYALSTVLLVTYLLAGVFTYLYCRVLGLGRAGAAAAGMSFGVCGFIVAHARHAALVGSAAWLPLMLLVVERAVQAEGRAAVRRALWLAPVSAVAMLAGAPQMVYISALLLVAYAAARAAGTRRAVRPAVGLAAVVAAAVVWGLALAAPQVLPTAELSRLSERSAGVGMQAADPHPLPGRDLLTLFWSSAVGRSVDGSYRARGGRGIYWEDYCYVGSLVVGLAVLGLPWTRRRPAAVFWLAAAVVGVALALGQRGTLYPLALKWAPGMSLFRFPERFLLVTQLGAAVLGGMGLDALARRLPGRGRLVTGAVLAGIVATLAPAQARQNVYVDGRAWLRPPATVEALRRLDPRGEWRCHTVLPDLVHYRRIVHGGEAGNRAGMLADRGMLTPNANMVWGPAIASGYAELVTARPALLWHGQQTRSVVPATELAMYLNRSEGTLRVAAGYLDLLGAGGVRWLLSAWPLAGPGLRVVARAGGFTIYENPRALPRAWLVGEARPLGERRMAAVDETAQAGLAARNFLWETVREGRDFGTAVYLDGVRPTATGGDKLGPVAVPPQMSRGGLQVTLRPDAPRACWLVLADAWYPGWTATVDGKPATIARANYMYRAVPVPAGRHTVIFTYHSRPLLVGVVVAAAALAAWLAAMHLLGSGGSRREAASPREPSRE